MLQYILRRLIALVFVIIGMAVIAFVVSHLIPADPAALAAGLDANAEQIERVREDLGLNEPLPVQFLTYVKNLATGDLGRSLFTGRPVIEDLQTFFPATLELAIWSLIMIIVIGVPLGVLSATRRGTLIDTGSRFFSTLWVGMPEFWFAILLQILFYRNLGWFPAGSRIAGDVEAPTKITGLYSIDALLTLNWSALGSSLHHLVLPVLALSLARVAVVSRLARSGMIEVLSQDYIRTARAKGLRERIVIYRHALKNAALPVLTQIGNQFGFLLGGTILVESVFQWPGLGSYAVGSIVRVDFNPIIGVALLASIVFVLVNLVVDLLYKVFDPRIEF